MLNYLRQFHMCKDVDADQLEGKSTEGRCMLVSMKYLLHHRPVDKNWTSEKTFIPPSFYLYFIV